MNQLEPTLAAALLACAVLAGCGGGGGGGNGGAVAEATPPASAAASVDGLIDYMELLVAVRDGGVTALELDGFDPPTSDSDEARDL